MEELECLLETFWTLCDKNNAGKSRTSYHKNTKLNLSLQNVRGAVEKRAYQALCHWSARGEGELALVVPRFVGCVGLRRSCGALSCWGHDYIMWILVDSHRCWGNISKYRQNGRSRYIYRTIFDVSFLYWHQWTALHFGPKPCGVIYSKETYLFLVKRLVLPYFSCLYSFSSRQKATARSYTCCIQPVDQNIRIEDGNYCERRVTDMLANSVD